MSGLADEPDRPVADAGATHPLEDVKTYPLEQVPDAHAPLIRELEALRVGPDERLVIRIDPSVELEAAGFHEALQQVLYDAGLGGRCVVISLPITKVEFAIFRDEQGLRGAIVDEGR